MKEKPPRAESFCKNRRAGSEPPISGTPRVASAERTFGTTLVWFDLPAEQTMDNRELASVVWLTVVLVGAMLHRPGERSTE